MTIFRELGPHHIGLEISNWIHMSAGQIDCENPLSECTAPLCAIHVPYIQMEEWNDVSEIQSSNGQQLLVFHMSNCHIYGSVQERRSSIANALELRLSCTNPSICTHLWPLNKWIFKCCIHGEIVTWLAYYFIQKSFVYIYDSNFELKNLSQAHKSWHG